MSTASEEVVHRMRTYRALATSGEYEQALREVARAQALMRGLVEAEAAGSDRRRKLTVALDEVGEEEQLISALRETVATIPRASSGSQRKENASDDLAVWPPSTAPSTGVGGQRRRQPDAALPAWAQQPPQRRAPPQQRYHQQRKAALPQRRASKPTPKVVECKPKADEVRKKYSEWARENGLGDIELIDAIERDIVEEGGVPIKWGDIAELREAKLVLEETVVLPLLMPDFFKGIRRPWKGVLLFGPPGTGQEKCKTLLAKAVSSECKTTFFNVSATTLSSKWRGESEKMVRLLFEMARHSAPSTIFFDEIDALAGQRGTPNEHEASRRVKTTLLAQMDGVESANDGDRRVVVLAATNLPWELDEALRRRLEKRIYIPLPTRAARITLFKLNMRDVDVEADVDLGALADKTDGYSGADVANVCRDAAMMSVRRAMEAARARGLTGSDMHRELVANQAELSSAVSNDDFLHAINKVHPSVGQNDLRRYDDWKAEYGAA